MADKQLDTTTAASAFQKQWFADLRRRVFDERRPYALLQADVPFELFDLLEIPAVSNQWWASIIAAKRQAPQFLGAMDADGLRRATPRRVSRRGAVCRHPACCAPGSPAIASIASSNCGPRHSGPSCSRSIIRAPASCRNAGGNWAGANGGSSSNRTVLRSTDVTHSSRTCTAAPRPGAHHHLRSRL